MRKNIMKIIYRISDGGYNKLKPKYVTKRGIFLHFLKIFKDYEIYVVADNVVDETYAFLCENVDISHIFRTSLSNAGAFMYALDYAISNFNDEDIVYFAEDDYIYTENAGKIIIEGLKVGDYSSGYDHPDKYLNHSEGGPNPYVKNGGEITRVKITENRHWKITNSCCMTFAVKLETVKADYDIIYKYCCGRHPYDFEMFLELRKINKRDVVSCIPAVSSHGEIAWLSPFIDWEKEFNKTL